MRHLLAQNLTWSGLATDSNATAVHIKSDVSRGGVVQDLTYQNICSKDLRYAIWLDPFYSGLTKTGTLLPWYKDITDSEHAPGDAVDHRNDDGAGDYPGVQLDACRRK